MENIINNLIKFKKYISSNIVMMKFIHYCKDLRNYRAENIDSDCDSLDSEKELQFVYYKQIPHKLVDALGVLPEYLIYKDLSCLIASYKNEPAGCILFNLGGDGKLIYPFIYERQFREKHAYVFFLFVNKDFRGKSIGKQLYLELFKTLKDSFDYIDAFTESEELIPNNVIQKVGFKKINVLYLFKVFKIRIVLNCDSILKNAIYTMLVSLYQSAINIAKIIVKFIKALVKSINRIYSNIFYHAYFLSNASDEESLKVAFISKKMYDKAILNKIFEHKYEIERDFIFFRKDLAHQINILSEKVNLIIVEGKYDRIFKRLSYMKDVIFAPNWVVQKNDSFKDFTDFKKTQAKHKNNTAYADIKRVRKHNYSYIFTKSEELLRFFYKNMHQPNISNRHKDEGMIEPFDLVKKRFDNGGLVLVKDKDRYIAGTVIELKNKTVHAYVNGILNGDVNLLKEGASNALYYFYFIFAKEKGLKTIDMGLSRAFLNDRILRYKTKWNTKISFDKKRSNVFALKICNMSDPVKRFLINNPFISIEKDKLVGNIYLDSTSDIDNDKITKMYKMNGISELRITNLELNTAANREYRTVNDDQFTVQYVS